MEAYLVEAYLVEAYPVEAYPVEAYRPSFQEAYLVEAHRHLAAVGTVATMQLVSPVFSRWKPNPLA